MDLEFQKNVAMLDVGNHPQLLHAPTTFADVLAYCQLEV